MQARSSLACNNGSSGVDGCAYSRGHSPASSSVSSARSYSNSSCNTPPEPVSQYGTVDVTAIVNGRAGNVQVPHDPSPLA